MDDLLDTESGITPEGITTKVQTYCANSVTNAGDVTFEAHTYCKRETGVQTVEE